MVSVENNHSRLLVDFCDITNEMRINGNGLPAWGLLKGNQIVCHALISTVLCAQHDRELGGVARLSQADSFQTEPRLSVILGTQSFYGNGHARGSRDYFLFPLRDSNHRL